MCSCTGKGVRLLFGISFIMTSFMRALPLWPNYFTTILSLPVIILGIKFQCTNFEKIQTFHLPRLFKVVLNCSCLLSISKNGHSCHDSIAACTFSSCFSRYAVSKGYVIGQSFQKPEFVLMYSQASIPIEMLAPPRGGHSSSTRNNTAGQGWAEPCRAVCCSGDSCN